PGPDRPSCGPAQGRDLPGGRRRWRRFAAVVRRCGPAGRRQRRAGRAPRRRRQADGHAVQERRGQGRGRTGPAGGAAHRRRARGGRARGRQARDPGADQPERGGAHGARGLRVGRGGRGGQHRPGDRACRRGPQGGHSDLRARHRIAAGQEPRPGELHGLEPAQLAVRRARWGTVGCSLRAGPARVGAGPRRDRAGRRAARGPASRAGRPLTWFTRTVGSRALPTVLAGLLLVGCGATGPSAPVDPPVTVAVPPIAVAPIAVAPIAVAAVAAADRGDGVPPARIRLPSLGVDTAVVAVGVDGRGEMAVPEDVRQTGWYRFGPAPGSAAGSSVVSGHVDDAVQGRGAFYRLVDLAVGDHVVVTTAAGVDLTFRVSTVRRIPKSALPVDELFARDAAARSTARAAATATTWW